MKKILLAGCVAASLFAGEVQFGEGNFKIDSKLLGLGSSKSENITSISLVNEHNNIFSSNYFYAYKIAYFKSKTLTTSSNYLGSSINKLTTSNLTNNNSNSNNSVPNNTTSNTNNTSATPNNLSSVPTTTDINQNDLLIYQKLRGIDINFVLGRDFINTDDRDTYLGAGLLVGASFPYVKSNSNNNSSSSNSSEKYLKKSKTKFYTYKLGLDVKGAKAINKVVSFYASGAYAIQRAKIKNTALNLDSSSNGHYMTFNTGIKFQLKTHMKIWFLKLSPNVFATMGYRYDYWKVNNVKINSLALNTDITMRISQVYAGVGFGF